MPQNSASQVVPVFLVVRAFGPFNNSSLGRISCFLGALKPEKMFPSWSYIQRTSVKEGPWNYICCALDFKATFKALQIDKTLFFFSPYASQGRSHGAECPPHPPTAISLFLPHNLKTLCIFFSLVTPSKKYSFYLRTLRSESLPVWSLLCLGINNKNYWYLLNTY